MVMKKLVVCTATFLIVGSSLLFQTASAVTTTRWVNDDAASYSPPGASCADAGYAKIQAAIDASSPGDVINVCPGTYNENVAVNKADLTINSTGGASVTTINAAQSFYVFQITAIGLTLEGFTIVPAGVADGDIGVNVAI